MPAVWRRARLHPLLLRVHLLRSGIHGPKVQMVFKPPADGLGGRDNQSAAANYSHGESNLQTLRNELAEKGSCLGNRFEKSICGEEEIGGKEMKEFRKLAMKSTLATYIYFAAMMMAAAAPLIALYMLLYAAGGR